MDDREAKPGSYGTDPSPPAEMMPAAALAAVGASIWRLEVESGRVHEWSGAAGETARAGDLEHLLARVHPEDRDAFDRALHDAILQGGWVHAELRLRDPEGKWVWKLCHGRKSAAAGRCVLVGLFRDTTEQERGARELGERHERAMLALQAGGVGTFDWDLGSGRIHWSAGFAELFGISGGFGESYTAWAARIHPDDAKRLDPFFESWLADGGSDSIWEYRYRRSDGRLRWLAARGRIHRNERGRAVRIVGTQVDVTEAKRIEERLRRSEENALRRLREIDAIYDAAPVGLCIFDARFRFVRINERMAEINGAPAADHLGRTLREVLPDLADQTEAMLRQVLATGRPLVNVEVTGTTPAQPGVERVWLEQWYPLLDEHGRATNVGAVAVEITERKRAERALLELTAELEERVALRTALAERRARDLRRLAAQLEETEQRERRRLAEMLHDHLQQILVAAVMRLPALQAAEPRELEQEVAQIAQLLQESIQVSRNLTTELSPPILHHGTLGEALAWLARWCGDQHGLTVRYQEWPRTGARVGGDGPVVAEHIRVFLFQAARELLLNVVKHSGQRRATLRLVVRFGRVMLEVADQGRGFDPAVLGASREPLGFGLFSIRERLEAIGGRLRVRSTPRGGGARFRLFLPLVDPVEASPAATPSAAGDATI